MNRWRLGAQRRRERGASLVLVAVGIVVLLAAMALAIDLGLLYVARNEAQRAADSAALAGAYTFVASGCLTTGGCSANGPQEAVARQQAITVGGQNFIEGEAASIQDSDVTFSYPNPLEPQITVAVSRTAARKNSVPTIFARVFSVFQSDVAAAATAEAFTSTANTCIAPFLVPNCDPQHLPAQGQPYGICGTETTTGTNGPAGPFLQNASGNWQIANAGLYPAGIFGEPWPLHSGIVNPTGPAGSAVPSQWYMLSYSGSNSKADLRTYLTECYPGTINCGDTLTTDPGNAVGPVSQGVETRINASGLGMGQGQDTIDTSSGPPFTIKDSSGNAISGVSRSIVTVPIYTGQPLQPGANNQVQVIGFMELFIQDVEKAGNALTVNSVVLNISGCPASGGGGGGTGTGIPISVRLIRQ